MKIIYKNMLNENQKAGHGAFRTPFPNNLLGSPSRSSRALVGPTATDKITSTSRRCTPRRYQWKLHLGRLRGRGGPW